MLRPFVRYREYAPCEALRKAVRAFFTFIEPKPDKSPNRLVTREVLFGAGDSFASPLFADGHASLVFSIPKVCRTGGMWHPLSGRAKGTVIGAMSVVGRASGDERLEMVGVFFRAGWAQRFLSVPAFELTDRIVAIDDLWGAPALALATRLQEESEDVARVDLLETALLHRMREPRRTKATVDVPGLAALIVRRRGLLTVERLAQAAGVSRQHLTREFRESAGVTPKLYLQLARFQAALVYCGCGKNVNWSEAASEAGYADQSHMIAEFRRFSSLTPGMLASRKWFHPFIERARVQPSGATAMYRLVT